MPYDVLTIARELAEITRLVEDDDFTTTLDRFVARAVRTVPGCGHAIITVRCGGAVETVAGAPSTTFDATAPGPVVEAVTFSEPRRLDDVATDQRWPSFAAQMSRAGYSSCLAVPLSTESDQTAVLTLFSAQANQFADTAYDIALLLTLHAGVVFDNATLYHDSNRLVTQLRTALHTRSLIGQAQGLLMHRLDYDGDRAITALKQVSQDRNTKLRDLAGILINAHQQGELEATFRKLALVDAGKTPS